ncbi:hypothetical protein P7K49_017656 [Saguinus oedipus]|uniref:Uncharacterized protein n=1 Tax=Saguinus oedipus TaxID=9490 RepID=A0ABQ9V438_SAGOE|nr:hypothetical protein P7K49_017656 [Saguinus oedipus]
MASQGQLPSSVIGFPGLSAPYLPGEQWVSLRDWKAEWQDSPQGTDSQVGSGT